VLRCDEPLSNVAFDFNLRRYTEALEGKLATQAAVIARAPAPAKVTAKAAAASDSGDRDGAGAGAGGKFGDDDATALEETLMVQSKVDDEATALEEQRMAQSKVDDDATALVGRCRLKAVLKAPGASS